MDAQVRKERLAVSSFFFKEIERGVQTNDASEESTENYLVARASWAFNADQVTGWRRPPTTIPNLVEVLAKAEAFIQPTGADIREGGEMACYLPEPDYIEMPARELSTGTATSSATEAYYGTQLHELTHYAVSRIMPHGRALRRANLFRAMRQFGIIEPSGNDEVWWETDWRLQEFVFDCRQSACARIAASNLSADSATEAACSKN